MVLVFVQDLSPFRNVGNSSLFVWKTFFHKTVEVELLSLGKFIFGVFCYSRTGKGPLRIVPKECDLK